MSLDITIRKEGRVAVLCLAGNLTVDNARLARGSIQTQLKEGTDSFCLDLGALNRIDTAGLREIITVYSSIRNEGSLARLREISSRFRELLQIARLRNAFNSDPPMPDRSDTLMKKEKREWLRSQLFEARRELDMARRHPYFGCDVCGPYGHTFHVCQSAVAKAIKGFLRFHNHEPGEIYDLKRLVAMAAAEAPGFESCMNNVLALEQSGELTWKDFNYKPSESELNKAIQLAEELVAFVSSALLEDVR